MFLQMHEGEHKKTIIYQRLFKNNYLVFQNYFAINRHGLKRMNHRVNFSKIHFHLL